MALSSLCQKKKKKKKEKKDRKKEKKERNKLRHIANSSAEVLFPQTMFPGEERVAAAVIAHE